MLGTRPVAVFAADVLQFGGFCRGDIAGLVLHTDDVADDTFGVIFGADLFERSEGVGVPAVRRRLFTQTGDKNLFACHPLFVFIVVAEFAVF